MYDNSERDYYEEVEDFYSEVDRLNADFYTDNMFEVVENAGTDNQVTVYGPASLGQCRTYVRNTYYKHEQERLGVDIVCENG